MEKSPNPLPDAVRDAMDDLITGQSSLLTAWHLRCRIARDPEYAREWAKLQELHTHLQQLAQDRGGERSRYHVPASTSTIRIGKIIMQKRTAWIAATVLSIFAVTGAIAERNFAPRVGDSGCFGANRDTDWWYFHGTFRGRVRILTPAGKLINTIDVKGDSTAGSVNVQFTRSKREVASKTFQGIGRHALYGADGKLAAYIELSPFTSADNSQIAQDEQEILENMSDFIRRPERVTPDYSKYSFYHVTSLPGVVGGTSIEFFQTPGKSYAHSHPFAWKSYGSVHVVARQHRPAEPLTAPGKPPVHKGKRTLVDEGESLPIPTAEQLQQLPPTERRYFALLPKRSVSVPETYWSIGSSDRKRGATNERGEWRTVERSGCFKGYGHFVVRDLKTREVLLTLDVTPPHAMDAVAAITRRDSVKPTRVVPGWTNEK